MTLPRLPVCQLSYGRHAERGKARRKIPSTGRKPDPASPSAHHTDWTRARPVRCPPHPHQLPIPPSQNKLHPTSLVVVNKYTP
ncbi:hypothetical protein VTJ04DRAFT_3873 [Mycothermus thermophilus]|uniref:uncharacterized protein n=1 Tax=Humicola insolens TaxID=85995 RepID=UPI0037445BA5